MQMSRKVMACGIACAALFFGILLFLLPERGSAEDKGDGMDVLVIDNKGYKSDRKGPVTFTHRKHAMEYRISCWECHHEYQDGKNVYAPWENTATCSECHDPKKDQGKAMNLQKAFHVNCKNCHQGLAAKKLKTGPYKKCLGCHKEENPKK